MINDHYRVRKKARKHGKWGLKQDSSSCTKIKNSKSGGNMYSEFEEKFGVFSEFYFVHTIYHFESWEVRSPTLQTVCKLELKWRSYDNLNTIAQSLKGHFKMILKSNLWIRNPILNDLSFEFTHCHFDVHILYLKKCFKGTSSTLNGPHTARNHHFIIF